MRNIKKQREQGSQIVKQHRNADLMCEELVQLRDSFKRISEEKGISEAVYDIICDSFYFGLAVGYRTGKKDSVN